MTAQLDYAKGKLRAYEKVKGAPQEKKPANTYANIALWIVGTRDAKRMNIGQKPLLLVIEPKNKDKFKTMEEATTSLQNAFCPSQNKVKIKKIIKRKEHIVVETDTIEALQKLKSSIEIGWQFPVEEANGAKPRIILYDISTSVPEEMIKKMISRQNELYIEWSIFYDESVPKFRTGLKAKELCN